MPSKQRLQKHANIKISDQCGSTIALRINTDQRSTSTDQSITNLTALPKRPRLLAPCTYTKILHQINNTQIQSRDNHNTFLPLSPSIQRANKRPFIIDVEHFLTSLQSTTELSIALHQL
ncbi:hypothetical protein Tcan_15147 [Toxocara canis]|uniref:Uncharacterized protein n=1 Tax=Toxocara canis TaxID=6265 RepID=A0A0B2V7X7_TOXCA|nr:hypothetical protein Tcan_15147 [Toxocara canis]